MPQVDKNGPPRIFIQLLLPGSAARLSEVLASLKQRAPGVSQHAFDGDSACLPSKPGKEHTPLVDSRLQAAGSTVLSRRGMLQLVAQVRAAGCCLNRAIPVTHVYAVAKLLSGSAWVHGSLLVCIGWRAAASSPLLAVAAMVPSASAPHAQRRHSKFKTLAPSLPSSHCCTCYQIS